MKTSHAPTVSNEARGLHAEAVVVECHNDLILLVGRDLAVGRPDPFGTKWIPDLRVGGIDVQVIPIHTGEKYEPEGSLRRTMKLVGMLHKEVARNSDDLALCGTGSEIQSAVDAGKIALVLAFEGSAAFAGDDELVELFYKLGLRMASFSWFGRTALADGSGEEATGGRLTRAGVRVLGEMERLGILFDVSHLSRAGIEHALEISSRPVIASHSSARAICDHHRNLSDDQIIGIAATGGVIGVNFFPGFIDPESPTVDRIVDHIEHIAEVAGMDHVGIGPDFVRELFDEFYPTVPELRIEGLDAKATIENLETCRDLPVLTETLLRRGFEEKDVKKVLGENFVRVFGEVLGSGAGEVEST